MAFEVKWTSIAIEGLSKVISYLEDNWTVAEILKLELRIKVVIEQIKFFPDLYPKSNIKPQLHKALIDKNNYVVYRVNNETIEILFFKGTKQKDS